MSIQGMPELTRRLNAIQNPKGLLAKLQLDTTYEAKHLVRRKTGNTARTIRPGFLGATEAFVTAGGAAIYLERGTRPHIIKPKHGKALRFPSSGTSTTLGGRVRTGEVRRLGSGAYAFAREVHHPGTKPRPFLLPGAKAAVAKGGLADTVVALWNKAA